MQEKRRESLQMVLLKEKYTKDGVLPQVVYNLNFDIGTRLENKGRGGEVEANV